ncbi:hypothetical protein B0H66DRAFT_563369 [Apodospora peruviana]|uniref:Uncharacterized protein n=1 Tax=Apodospora peruviana TaxID=516989 RepID=A0AAE0HXH8_9PEZI|nr:hypothetical protein B0H66DRAFT_563369 [Apodospora peruviana]
MAHFVSPNPSFWAGPRPMVSCFSREGERRSKRSTDYYLTLLGVAPGTSTVCVVVVITDLTLWGIAGKTCKGAGWLALFPGSGCALLTRPLVMLFSSQLTALTNLGYCGGWALQRIVCLTALNHSFRYGAAELGPSFPPNGCDNE